MIGKAAKLVGLAALLLKRNAVGLLYLLKNGQESVFADDSRGFPLRIGTLFVAKELRVDDEQR